MEIKELKQKIEEQRTRNIELYNSIPLASHEDPMNEKAEPILKEWREGSKILKQMLAELSELESKNVKTHKEKKRKVPRCLLMHLEMQQKGISQLKRTRERRKGLQSKYCHL